MSGVDFARKIDRVLAERGISKGEFYAAVGISATAMYGWKNGATPKPETVDAIEKYLGISFSDYEKSNESDELREMLRDRQDLRILLHSAKDVPASSVYALIAQIEKMKEDST
jgi:predicted transcriptional regulator